MEKENILQALSRSSGRKSLPVNEDDRRVEILTVLSELSTLEDRSGKNGRSLRKRLRDMGFRLSNPAHVQEAKDWVNQLA